MPDYTDIVKALIANPESEGSHYDKNGKLIKNKMGSSAIGKYQIVNSTWNNLSLKHKKQSGRLLNKENPSDHEIAMSMLLEENANRLKSMGVPVNAVTLYGMHVKGNSWVKKAISNPNTPISSLFTQEEIKKNPTYLGNNNRTLGDTMRVLTSKINSSAKKLNIPTQGNPVQNPKSYNMDETQQQYVNFRKELAGARQRYSGTELDKVESNIVKKYKDLGFIPAFNDLQNRINAERTKSYKDKAQKTFQIANNLGTIMQNHNSRNQFEYEIKNKKTFIPRDSKIPLGKFSEQELKAFEEISGKKVDRKSGGIPTSYFLKTLQNNLKTYTGENINLINGDNSRGKDLMFEGTYETNELSLSKPHKNVANVYIGNPQKKNGGIMGMLDSSYEKRNFQYNPELMQPITLSPIDYDNNTFNVSDEELNTNLSSESGFTPTAPIDYNPVSYNPQDMSYYQTPDAAASNQRYRDLLNKKVAERTPAENEELKRLSDNKASNDAMDTMMRSFQDADSPQQYSYDPSGAGLNDVPYSQLASAMFGVIAGSDMADTEMPARNEQVSASFQSYAAELQRLSEIGLRPEDEAYAKRMLAESYSSGLQQITRASGGNRNIVLSNLGRLDYQKQRGLLEIAMADAQAKNEAFYKYGEAMKYISEFDSNRDIANNERQYQNAMLTKQTGGQLMSQGWQSLMNGIQYYQDNKPGSANHAYKAYMNQQMFGFDPDKKDNGLGDTPGTKSFKDKNDKENMVRYLQNKEMADQYFAMPENKRQMFNDVANSKGWGEETKGFLNFLNKNEVSGMWNPDAFDDAKQTGNYAAMFSPTDSQKQDSQYVNKEIPQSGKMFEVSEDELSPITSPKQNDVIMNPPTPINFDLIQPPKNQNNSDDFFFRNAQVNNTPSQENPNNPNVMKAMDRGAKMNFDFARRLESEYLQGNKVKERIQKSGMNPESVLPGLNYQVNKVTLNLDNDKSSNSNGAYYSPVDNKIYYANNRNDSSVIVNLDTMGHELGHIFGDVNDNNIDFINERNFQKEKGVFGLIQDYKLNNGTDYRAKEGHEALPREVIADVHASRNQLMMYPDHFDGRFSNMTNKSYNQMKKIAIEDPNSAPARLFNKIGPPEMGKYLKILNKTVDQLTPADEKYMKQYKKNEKKYNDIQKKYIFDIMNRIVMNDNNKNLNQA